VAFITFWAEGALPFHGHNGILWSPKNRHFLGILEVISQFDPILKEQFKAHEIKEK
jgi:hypothetical protein